MKRATFHVECNGEPVDFEIYEDGEIIVSGYDIEPDQALAELGFKPGECLSKLLMLRDAPFGFIKRLGAFGTFFSDNEVTAVLTVSMGHITENDDDVLSGQYEASGLYYGTAEHGFRFYLTNSESPRDLVAATKNRDGLSNSLIEALQVAFDHGIYEVYFDADGLALEGVEIHEWL